jgi:hypothetical protein
MQESERDNRSLDAALRAVAEDEARLNASASVEQRLRAEVRSIALRRRRRYAAALALAAALLIAAAAPAWWMSKRRAGASSTPADSSSPQAAASVAEVSTSFLPLAYSGVPITNGQLVRLEVPRAALASFGLAPLEDLDSPSSGTVLADVLVGEDGLARAVRFVRVAGGAAQKEQKP